MSYAIVYSSRTGNTALLAHAIQEALPQADCVFCGAPSREALAADTLYVGFWTDKGTCDEAAADFLKQLTGQKVFLFGTAGFGGSEAYFAQIMERVKGNLAPGVQVLGTYMCQGKMPQAVRTRFEQMPESPRRAMMLANFDQAVSHPDNADLARLKEAVAG